jgi:hypothetical protein
MSLQILQLLFQDSITFENVLYLIYDILSIGSFASELLMIIGPLACQGFLAPFN